MKIEIEHVDPKLHDRFLDVQIYHLVRHEIAHGDHDDGINVGDAPWRDTNIVEYCKRNKNGAGRKVFPHDTTPEQARAAICRVCDGANDKVKSWPSEPLIFFYASFSLGAYHKLAKDIDRLLP